MTPRSSSRSRPTAFASASVCALRASLAVMLAASLASSATALAAGTGAAAAAASNAKKRCIASAESGQTLRASGKLVDARASFVTCTAAECPAPVRKDCGRWVDELDGAMPSISVRLEDAAGNEVHGGNVQVDGQPFVQAEGGRATPIDPGSHTFDWMRPEGNIHAGIVLHEGEQNRIVRLHVPGSTFVPSVDPETQVTSGVDTAQPVSHAPPSQLPWIVSGSVAVVAAGVGFTLWGVGLNERSSLVSTCAPGGGCSSSQVDTSRDKLVAGDVLVGVGIVAAAAAVYFFIKSRPAHGDTRAHTGAALLTSDGAAFTF